METGQHVKTPDGRSGRIVAVAGIEAHRSQDEARAAVSAVLLDDGEVRWYVEGALTPLTWAPIDRAPEPEWHPASVVILDASTFWG